MSPVDGATGSRPEAMSTQGRGSGTGSVIEPAQIRPVSLGRQAMERFKANRLALARLCALVGLVGWPPLMRFVRALTLSLKEKQFVEAATSIGTPRWKIITRHILPNTWGLVLVQATFGVGGFIYNETTLSLLGLGVQPPNPDL